MASLELMALWRRHKDECRPVGEIVADARNGNLPGIEPITHGFNVTDEKAALAAMRKETAL